MKDRILNDNALHAPTSPQECYMNMWVTTHEIDTRLVYIES